MSKKQSNSNMLVTCAVFVGMAMLVSVVSHKAKQPDFGKTMQMKFLLGLKDFSQSQADFWQDNALRASTAYQRVRL